MKKLSYLIISLLFLSVIVCSCKKDEDTSEKFSTLSVEQNKAIVEDAGVDFIGVMNRMKSLETIDVLANLADLMSTKSSKGFLFTKDSKVISTLSVLTAAAKGDKKLVEVFDAMVSSKGLTEDPESIKEFWDDNVGTYTWNKTIGDWDIVLGGTKFIFKFPSKDVSTSNDAVFTIYDYTGVKISNPIDDEYTGDLPTAVKADLKVGTKTLVTYLFAASYNADGVPNAIASDLTIETFKFEIDIANDTKVVSVLYKFLESDKVIMDMGASGKGLFTESNYDANTITRTETYQYMDWVYNPSTGQWSEQMVTYTENYEETDFEEILNSATAHFQLFNIALRGDVNIKDLVDQIKLIDKDRENKVITEETAQNRYAARLNEHMNLRMVNITKNEIIAKAEAYVVKEIDYGYTDYYINFRLTFKDGSPVDMETYVDKGFDDFITQLNKLINDINSEYDLDIDNV